ncbi:hypothetical protein C0J50_3860 [Silurus asotus]|uniref:Ig-like domain-containing protein n=1 Tax=Silurus asotus TaxID=30991 RepID=A0AAD5FEK1_SILAS|nr:hypothetical protein C0J50_3860 [Silurus asotus]
MEVITDAELEEETKSTAGWKFYWRKYKQWPETETETHSYTITSVNVSDGGHYRCRAGRGNQVYYTHYSDALWVNVTENLKPVVIIRPDSHVFRGETVTFRCKIQGGGDTEWQFSWYKNNNPLYHNTQEFSHNSVIHEDSGNYTCRGLRSSDTQISEISDAGILTVSETAEAVVSVSPQSWLTEGDSVTLNCEIKSSSTGWTFSWYTDVLYRDSQGSYRYRPELLSDSSRGSGGSYTLSPVTLNHTGVYMCRAVLGELCRIVSKDNTAYIKEVKERWDTFQSQAIFYGIMKKVMKPPMTLNTEERAINMLKSLPAMFPSAVAPPKKLERESEALLHVLMPSEDPNTYLQRRPLSCPVLIVDKENCMVAIGTTPVATFPKNHLHEGALYLMVYYYALHLTYPKCIATLLSVLQTEVLQDEIHERDTTSSYRKAITEWKKFIGE